MEEGIFFLHQCSFQYFIHGFHWYEFQFFPDGFRDVFDIPFILLRQDDGLHPLALGSQDFLLEPTDWQHAATQGDLTGHSYIAAHLAVRQGRDHRRCHRDTG